MIIKLGVSNLINIKLLDTHKGAINFAIYFGNLDPIRELVITGTRHDRNSQGGQRPTTSEENST